MSPHTAEENLRVIRGLMERATIYRAISFPAAAFAGTVALVVGIGMAFSGILTSFIPIWLGVLLLCTLANGLFLWRESKKRGDRFLSSGMALALRVAAPILLMSVVFTMYFGRVDFFAPVLVIGWMVTYGLLLLSTQTFAPLSLIWLGWAFILTAPILPWISLLLFSQPLLIGIKSVSLAHFFMGIFFGSYHLIYAAVGLIIINTGAKSKAS